MLLFAAWRIISIVIVSTHECERSYFYYSEAVFYSQQALTILSIYFFKDVHYADNYSQTVSKVLK